jgi:hypothetical protein
MKSARDLNTITPSKYAKRLAEDLSRYDNRKVKLHLTQLYRYYYSYESVSGKSELQKWFQYHSTIRVVKPNPQKRCHSIIKG